MEFFRTESSTIRHRVLFFNPHGELKRTPWDSVLLCGETKQHTLKPFNHEQRNLEQDPEHRHYCTYRHRHHLRGDFLHGRVDNKRAQPLWNALSFLSGTHQNIDGFLYAE